MAVSTQQLIVAMLVWLTAGSALLSCIGMLAARDHFPRMHFMAPVADISAVVVVVAVGVQEGWGQPLIKAILVCLVLIVMNAVLAHATARATRVRDYGHWTAQPGEAITDAQGHGERRAQQARRRNE
jgi:multisubunit Na+/H+ antiporter MnhG subunit